MSAMPEPRQRPETAPDPIEVLKLRAASRALLWFEGLIENLAAAVDPLQAFAEQSGLVAEIGQDCVQQILHDAFTPYRDPAEPAEAPVGDDQGADDAGGANGLYCDTCGLTPCLNPSFCAGCRAADARFQQRRASEPQQRKARPTPQTTIEAILYCVRERGPDALCQPANVERLSRCDAAALAEIRERVVRYEAQR
jgi:hypothetical protein